MTVTEPAAEPEASEPNEGNPLDWPSAADIPDEVVEETPEPEATESAPEPEAEEKPAEETETPAEEPAVEEEPAAETFPREYVEKLRNEAADYRVQAKEFHEAFDGFEPETRAKFLDMARGLQDESRHVEVAQEFYEVARNIFQHYGVDMPEMVPDPNKPLTPAQLEARLQKEREDRDMQDRIAAIDREVTGLGYKAGEPDHYALLRLAHENDESIEQAHKRVEAWKKGIIDGFIAEFQKKQERHLDTAPQVGLAPAEQPEEAPTDWKGARGRLDQLLADHPTTG